jgi:RNA polymerase sigma factor (sigma-70 family)
MDAELTDRDAEHATESALAPLAAMSDAEFVRLVDERIVNALERLEDPMREIVMLSVAGGLSYREIAVVLRCPVGTVMSRMARARRKLREELAGHARAMGWTKEVCP